MTRKLKFNPMLIWELYIYHFEIPLNNIMNNMIPKMYCKKYQK